LIHKFDFVPTEKPHNFEGKEKTAMNAATLDIYDIFSGEWTREKAEQAAKAIKGLAKEQAAESIADRVEVQVEKTVLRESKDLATKGELHAAKEELSARIDKLDNRIVTGFIAILLGIIALMATMVWGFQSLKIQGNSHHGQEARAPG